MEFHVAQFKVTRLSDRGLWAVTGDNANDVGLLFLRAQEFYESNCKDIIGKSFTIAQFMKWYSEHVSEKKCFSYLDDFQGYNIPGDAVDRFLDTPIYDPNPTDFLFARLAQAVRVVQDGPYYIVGTVSGKLSFISHEIAHGMWALVPEYRDQARRLVNSLLDKEKIVEVMHREGYSENVTDDEINAYFATGLLTSLEDYEHLREPFMKLFYRYKRTFMSKPKKRPKPLVVARSWPFDAPPGEDSHGAQAA